MFIAIVVIFQVHYAWKPEKRIEQRWYMETKVIRFSSGSVLFYIESRNIVFYENESCVIFSIISLC